MNYRKHEVNLKDSYHLSTLTVHLGMSPPSSCFKVTSPQEICIPPVPILHPPTPNSTLVRTSTETIIPLLRYRAFSFAPTSSATNTFFSCTVHFKTVVAFFPCVNSPELPDPNSVSSSPIPAVRVTVVLPYLNVILSLGFLTSTLMAVCESMYVASDLTDTLKCWILRDCR